MATTLMVAKNSATTTLNGDINDSVTTVTVTDGSVFPSTFPFPVSCDSEIMLCTNRVGNDLTVTRAAESTAADSHSDGTTIELRITAKYITDLNTAVNACEATGIADTNYLVVDDADAASGQACLFTASGVEGRAIGISDTNILRVDDAAAADNDFARFTASGIEGLTVAEAITALLASAMPENVAVILDESLSADGKYSGICFAGTAGANLAFGQVVYLASADSKWELTDADAEATTKPRIAIVTVAGNEDATIQLMAMGYIREDDWNWTTPGAPLFLDTATAGGLTETAPSGSGDCIRIAGYVQDANSIFFNPENAWDELA